MTIWMKLHGSTFSHGTIYLLFFTWILSYDFCQPAYSSFRLRKQPLFISSRNVQIGRPRNTYVSIWRGVERINRKWRINNTPRYNTRHATLNKDDCVITTVGVLINRCGKVRLFLLNIKIHTYPSGINSSIASHSETNCAIPLRIITKLSIGNKSSQPLSKDNFKKILV